MAEPVWIPSNETVANTTQVVVQQGGSYSMMDMGIAVLVVGFIFLILAKKLGLKMPGGVHLLNQRKQALRDTKTAYIKYIKNHGTKTNQKLYYGATRIGSINRVAAMPYKMKLTHKELDKRINKEVFRPDKDSQEGTFYLFEIKRYWGLMSRFNEIYLIDKEYVPNVDNDVINIGTQVSFDIYFGIWISKGRVEITQIEESMWKYQNEIILSALPTWAESIASASSKTANDSAIATKEAEIEAEKRRKYVKDF